MAAPMELFCWSGGWGLPSVDLDSLAVLTYARFTGAPLKVHKISNPWQSPSGTQYPLGELCLPFGPVMERSSQFHTRSSPTFEKRSTMLIMICQLGKGQTPWPSCLSWRRSCSRCWYILFG
ncbi:MTX1 isoform 7 [Pan troglodytes]|uniref:Metaxin 1 n=2 Tax=Homininae TaxID=207598 RepID=H0Y6Y5_HUMAN|nr:metaxin 1 [Homo sapiens]KAI4083024.1 metaxin 1 [Homo sapiens]PNI90589.1 MTX1 isoform 7 [Pan troglodytes]